MEDLKPECQVINGICYRINRCNLPSRDRAGEVGAYEEDDLFHPVDISCQRDEEEGYEIEEASNRTFKTSFHVPSVFFPHLIGAKGNTMKRLRAETGCQISIPKPGHTGDVVVSGMSRREVASARRRIEMIVSNSRSRQFPTHFVSFHLGDGSFIEGYNKFKSLVIENCNESKTITENLFICPHLLHLTLTVVTISDAIERTQVSDHLKACHEQVVQPYLKGERLNILVKGLDIMNDDVSQVQILYAKLQCTDGSNKLQELADRVSHFFNECSFVPKNQQRQSVKLHITVMKARKPEGAPEGTKKVLFNASSVMENYKDYTFGESTVTSFELCAVGSSSEDKYYTITYSVDL